MAQDFFSLTQVVDGKAMAGRQHKRIAKATLARLSKKRKAKIPEWLRFVMKDLNKKVIRQTTISRDRLELAEDPEEDFIVMLQRVSKSLTVEVLALVWDSPSPTSSVKQLDVSNIQQWRDLIDLWYEEKGKRDAVPITQILDSLKQSVEQNLDSTTSLRCLWELAQHTEYHFLFRTDIVEVLLNGLKSSDEEDQVCAAGAISWLATNRDLLPMVIGVGDESGARATRKRGQRRRSLTYMNMPDLATVTVLKKLASVAHKKALAELDAPHLFQGVERLFYAARNCTNESARKSIAIVFNCFSNHSDGKLALCMPKGIAALLKVADVPEGAEALINCVVAWKMEFGSDVLLRLKGANGVKVITQKLLMSRHFIVRYCSVALLSMFSKDPLSRQCLRSKRLWAKLFDVVERAVRDVEGSGNSGGGGSGGGGGGGGGGSGGEVGRKAAMVRGYLLFALTALLGCCAVTNHDVLGLVKPAQLELLVRLSHWKEAFIVYTAVSVLATFAHYGSSRPLVANQRLLTRLCAFIRTADGTSAIKLKVKIAASSAIVGLATDDTNTPTLWQRQMVHHLMTALALESDLLFQCQVMAALMLLTDSADEVHRVQDMDVLKILACLRPTKVSYVNSFASVIICNLSTHEHKRALMARAGAVQLLVGWLDRVVQFKSQYLRAGGHATRTEENETNFRGIPDFEKLQLYQAGALWMMMYDEGARDAFLGASTKSDIGTQRVFQALHKPVARKKRKDPSAAQDSKTTNIAAVTAAAVPLKRDKQVSLSTARKLSSSDQPESKLAPASSPASLGGHKLGRFLQLQLPQPSACDASAFPLFASVRTLLALYRPEQALLKEFLLSAVWVCCDKVGDRERVAQAISSTDIMPLLLEISTNDGEAFALRFKVFQLFQNVTHDKSLQDHPQLKSTTTELYERLGEGSVEHAAVLLLNSTSLKAQHYAAATIAYLAGKYPKKTKTVAQFDAIEKLLTLCEFCSERVKKHGALYEQCLLALVNLSVRPKNQVLISQKGLALVMNIVKRGLTVYAAPTATEKAEKDALASFPAEKQEKKEEKNTHTEYLIRFHELASQILLNIQQHPQSRTALYKTELRMKGINCKEAFNPQDASGASSLSNNASTSSIEEAQLTVKTKSKPPTKRLATAAPVKPQMERKHRVAPAKRREAFRPSGTAQSLQIHEGRRTGTACVNGGKYWAADTFATGKLKASIDAAVGTERKVRRWEPDLDAIQRLSTFKGVIENLDRDLVWPKLRVHDFRGKFLYTTLEKKDRTPVNMSILGPDKAFVEYRTWDHSKGATVCTKQQIPCVHAHDSKSARGPESSSTNPHARLTHAHAHALSHALVHEQTHKHARPNGKAHSHKHYYWQKFLQQSPREALFTACCEVPDNIFAGNEPAWPPPPVPTGTGKDLPRDPDNFDSPWVGQNAESKQLAPVLPKDIIELEIKADPDTLKTKIPALTFDWDNSAEVKTNGKHTSVTMKGGGARKRSRKRLDGGAGGGGDGDGDSNSDGDGGADGDGDGVGDGVGDGLSNGNSNGSHENEKEAKAQASTGNYSYFSNLDRFKKKPTGGGRPGKDGKPNYTQGDTLKLASPTEGATIYFTIDGSEPLPDGSNCLTGEVPLTLAGNVKIKAIAIKDGMYSSDPFEIDITVEETYENWAAKHSVFSPRIETGPSRSLYDSGKVDDRINELDGERIMSKSNFITFLDREIGQCGNPKCTAKDVMKALADTSSILTKVFDVYAAYDGEGFEIRLNSYTDFISDIGIMEPDVEELNRQSFDMLFIVCNQKHDNMSAEESKHNRKDAFIRYEFREMLVRAAIMKFVNTGKAQDPAEALRMICDLHIVPRLKALNVFNDTNDFRKLILYNKDVDRVLRKNYTVITKLFERLEDRYERRLRMRHYIDFIEKMGFFENHPFKTEFSRRHARLAFVWSRARTANELNRGEQQTITKEDFMECLCRIAWLKYLPTDEELQMDHVTTTPGESKVVSFFRIPDSTTYVMQDDNVAFRESRALDERVSKLLEVVVDTFKFLDKEVL